MKNSTRNENVKDPVVELKDLIYSKWSLTGSLRRTLLDWKLSIQPVEAIKKPRLTFLSLRSSQAPISGSILEGLEGDARLRILVEMRPKNSVDAHVKAKKEVEWKILEEIQRILLKETLPSGWIHAYVLDTRNLDDFDYEPPLLRRQITVLVKYVRMK